MGVNSEMSDVICLDQIHVSGSAESMGIQQGEALRERIVKFLNIRFAAVDQYARDRGRDSAAGLMDIGRESFKIYSEWDPEGFAEHCGIAQGAGVDPVELYTATNMTDMRDALLLSQGDTPPSVDSEGCSSLLVPGNLTADGQAIAGQTWDLNPEDIEYVVAIRRQPTDGLETWSVTCAGCLTLMGINASGVVVGTTNVKTWGSRPGIGYLATLHRMVRCHTASQASKIMKAAPRSGAHVFWVADPTTLKEYETSPDYIGRRKAIDQAICHTNHCIHPENVNRQGEEGSESSRLRLATMERVLAEGGHSVETIKVLFSDRSEGILSINRYSEDDQGTATNAVFIAIPQRREAFACRGPADRGEWVRLGFSKSA